MAGSVADRVGPDGLGMPYQRVRDAVIARPTMGKGLNLLFDALDALPTRP